MLLAWVIPAWVIRAQVVSQPVRMAGAQSRAGGLWPESRQGDLGPVDQRLGDRNPTDPSPREQPREGPASVDRIHADKDGLRS